MCWKIIDFTYQLLAHGRWFSPASSITKTGRHDIVEILMKVALNTSTLFIFIYLITDEKMISLHFLNKITVKPVCPCGHLY
jgi:hypothetical protein